MVAGYNRMLAMQTAVLEETLFKLNQAIYAHTMKKSCIDNIVIR